MAKRPVSAIAATSFAVALLAGVATADAQSGASDQQASKRSWMTEEAMRADFAGQTLDGHYGNQTTWTETYFADGRIDYKENKRAALGRWHFRAGSFCTFYDPPYVPDFVGGCWQVLKQGANCYEFYTAGTQLPPSKDGGKEEDDDVAGLDRPLRWNARGWRTSQPSTCPERPSV
jgi:hypothetical protein